MNPTAPKCCHKGSALFGLVAAILLFSILAAAIVPMVSSSEQQSVASNLAAKAYLLAESGYRYAASKYLHAGASEQDQNQALEDLDGDYALEGGEASFNLQLFSYFYELTQPVNGENQFTAHIPGNFADDEVVLDDDLKLRIGEQTYALTTGSAQLSDDTVVFHVTPSLANYPSGTPVYPVADIDTSGGTTLDEGDNLSYEPGDAQMFPLRNGTVQVNGRALTYQFNDRSANQLVNVRAPNHPGMANFDLSANPEMILTRYIRLQVTGIYGSDANAQIRRQVTYYTGLPLSASNAQQQAYSDQFNNDNTWSDTSGTATSSSLVGGDSALTVDSTLSIAPDQKGALTTFSPDADTAAVINFSASQRGTRGFLSYDSQIKVGYQNSPPPIHGFFPGSPAIPNYVGAGLSFRLGGTANLFSNNAYGLSFLRGNNDLPSDNVDDIPDELVPLQNQRALVLWRETDSGGQKTWLAYKRLANLLVDGDGDPLLDEDNETGGNAFDDGTGGTDLWDLEPVVLGDGSRQRSGSTRNWYFGIGAEHTYNWRSPPFTGSPVRSQGTITSDPIALPAGAPEIMLTFWSWHETEPGSPTRPLGNYDLKQIIVLTGSPPAPLITYAIEGTPSPQIVAGPLTDGWTQYQIDLSAYAGQSVRIRFRFDTVDEIENDFEGWYLDDVQLVAPWTAANIQEATFALSLKEAMVVRFDNGSAQIFQGDRIYGANEGTLGTVMVPPLISSGSWAGGDASGTLLLNRVIAASATAFESGEEIFVVGGTGEADVSSWSVENDTKANMIQVSLAAATGLGNGANSNPLDNNTRPYGRLGLTALSELVWPPALDNAGNWTDGEGPYDSSDDYFQIIGWDAINNDASGLFYHKFTTTNQGVVDRALLQSFHVELQTLDYPGIFEQPELGLHAFGDGAENVYFDDFGIRLNVFEEDTLPSPIQQ